MKILNVKKIIGSIAVITVLLMSGCGNYKSKKFGNVFNDFILNNQELNNFKPQKNKAVCYDLDRKKYTTKFLWINDGLRAKMREDLLAKEPDEVRFIILYTYEKVIVGYYNKGGKGIRFKCILTVYDTLTSSTKTFVEWGSHPPNVKQGSGDAAGGKPSMSREVIEYIDNVIQQEIN